MIIHLIEKLPNLFFFILLFYVIPYNYYYTYYNITYSFLSWASTAQISKTSSDNCIYYNNHTYNNENFADNIRCNKNCPSYEHL